VHKLIFENTIFRVYTNKFRKLTFLHFLNLTTCDPIVKFIYRLSTEIEIVFVILRATGWTIGVIGFDSR